MSPTARLTSFRLLPADSSASAGKTRPVTRLRRR
jgi:hypothetical protein